MRSRRWPWLAAGGVLCLAFVLRFYGLADHPPGIWFDPAYNGLDALRIMQRGGHTLFFPTNGGRESLFVYLLIPSIWMFGATPFAMRLVTALMGVLHVALLFGFLYDLPALIPPTSALAHRIRQQRLWLAVIGSLVLATSYWHLILSQRAERPIMVPLLSVPLFWFFLKGWYTPAWQSQTRWFALAGLMMGLEAYTYGAARLLPVILVVALAPELLRILARRRAAWGGLAQRRARAINLSIFVLVASIVCLPMVWYFLTHQSQFSARASSVTVWYYVHAPAQILAEIGRNVSRVLGYFCCAGSTTLFNGLPDYPGLSPWLAPFLAVGVVGAVLNSRQLVHRLLWCWWVIGLLPSLVTIEAPHPLRMLVAIVPTAILIALAPVYVSHWLVNPRGDSGMRLRVQVARRLPGLVMLLALAAAPFTWRAYFVDWATMPAVRAANDEAALAIRDATLARTAQGAAVYLPMSRLNDAPLLYYLGGAYDRQAALTPQGTEPTVYVIAPRRDEAEVVWVRFAGRTATILPPLAEAGVTTIQAALVGAAEPLLTSDGQTAAWVARLDADPGRHVQLPARRLAVSFGPVRLTGIRYPTTIGSPDAATVGGISGAEQTLPVTCYWQADGPMRAEYEVLLHLVDDNRRAWGNGDRRPTDWVYPTTFWRPGLDSVAARQEVALQAATLPPPGRYWLAIAVFDPATGQRLPVTEGGNGSPDTYLVGPLKVPLPPPSEELRRRTETLDARFAVAPRAFRGGEVIRLIGIAMDAPTVHPGDALQTTLLWQALKAPDIDFTVFLHVLDAQGQVVAGADSQPVGGTYPTSIWSPGEMVVDARTVRFVDGTGAPLPPGSYRLSLGVYDLNTGERLTVSLPDGQTVESRELVLDQAVHVTRPE